MNSEARRLPSKSWSIAALGSAGMAMVIVSYLLAIAVATGCLMLPILLFVTIQADIGSYLFARLLLSAFGLVAGFTILWSLLPRKSNTEVNGVAIDLAKQKRLAAHIESIATALKEPMPSVVYLLGDANAFVSHQGGFMGLGGRRIMGIGLPLLQMLTISQFRAVLAHEFAHYYGGDTRLGPWVYGAIRAIGRVYQNLGEKSDIMSILTRWVVVAAPYLVLMWAMRMYWMLCIRITQLISRRQEYRCDELACHLAGSQAVIDGLQMLHRAQPALQSYWNSIVLPVAVGGYQPPVAQGFLRFMSAPQIAKATNDLLAKEIAEGKSHPFDSHPPLRKRIERARRYNIPSPLPLAMGSASDAYVTSEMDDLDALEGSLLKKFVPALANSDLKPMQWETAAANVYVPMWRKEVANYLQWLEGQTLHALPGLVKQPKPVSDHVPTAPGMLPNRDHRDAKAIEILSRLLALSLIDHGWKLVIQPGTFYLENNGLKYDPFAAVANLKSGKLSTQQWESFCAEKGIGDWPLASGALTPPAVSLA